MARATRILCISLPLIGTIAILACLAYIGSAGIRIGDGDVDKKYFALIDTSKITTVVGKDVFKGLPDSHDNSKHKDVFAIYLWNYCSGKKTKDGYEINYCSGVRTPFDQYRVWNTWKVDITSGSHGGEDSKADKNQKLELGVKGISYLPKTIRALYSAAIAMTVLELIFGVVAIWTRWASFLTALTSLLATGTLIAASAMSQVLYGTLIRSIKKYDYSHFRRGELSASYGKSVYAFSWLAVVISLATTVCWIFSICCVSTTDKKKGATKSQPLGERLRTLAGGHKYEKMKSEGPESDGRYMGMQEQGSQPYAPYAYKGAGQV